MHIVTNAYRLPVAFNCREAVNKIRAPVMPSGWPKDIAPPLGLLLGSLSDNPNARVQAKTCADQA